MSNIYVISFYFMGVVHLYIFVKILILNSYEINKTV